MGSVTIIVHWIVVVVIEIVAVEIIDVTVVVVVNSIACDFTAVGPDVRLQVGMIILNTTVDDANDYRGTVRASVPSGFGIDIRWSPLVTVILIVGYCCRLHQIVRLSELDSVKRVVVINQIRNALTG